MSPTKLLKYVDSTNKQVVKFKEAWSKPFCDIESSYKLLVSDVKTMNENMILLQPHLGKPVALKGNGEQSVWDALATLGRAIADIEANNKMLDELLDQKITELLTWHNSFLQLANQTASIRQLLSTFEPHLAFLENSVRVHTDRFKHV